MCPLIMRLYRNKKNEVEAILAHYGYRKKKKIALLTSSALM
jgi:hypothetical protein